MILLQEQQLRVEENPVHSQTKNPRFASYMGSTFELNVLVHIKFKILCKYDQLDNTQ